MPVFATLAGAAALTGAVSSFFGNKNAKKAMAAQQAAANAYKKEAGVHANDQFDYFKNASNSILGALAQSKQDASATINSINKNYDKASDKQNAYLASMGYTPSANSVFLNSNAELAQNRINSIAQAQNTVNQQNFNNTLSGVGQAGNMYNTGYGNYSNYLNKSYDLQSGVNNMKFQHGTNQYNQGMNMVNNIAGSVIGGLAG